MLYMCTMNKNKCCSRTGSIVVSSPIGDMEIHSCIKGLHSVKQCAADDTTFIPDESCPIEIKTQVPKAEDDVLVYSYQCVDWLKNYFSNRIASTDIPPLCPTITTKGSFRTRAWDLLPRTVTFGTRITYAQLAQACDSKLASRAAGQAMALNPISLLIPCHRVIPSNGGVGNYHHGKKNLIKTWLLDFEERKE